MAHRRLLIGMVGLLAVAIGGVFVLLNQGKESPPALRSETSGSKTGGEIAREAFVAGVEKVVEPEVQVENEEMSAPTVPSEQIAQPVVKPAPKPVAKQPTTNPAPLSSLEPEVFSTSTPESTPSMPQPAGGPAPAPSPAPQPVEKININTAGLEELEQITGVGPAIAQRIIDYRTDVSLFYRVEDIKNVSGIGDITFQKMQDEITVENIVVPPAPQPEPTQAGKININTANYQELQKITGVGEVIAQRIIDWREQNGLFQRIEDIKNVKGIGDATFEKMRDEITI